MTDHKPQLPKTPTSSKVVYKNPWITVHEDTTVDKDGRKGLYAYIESPPSCMVIAQDEEQRIFLVHGFRYPSKTFGWELPGGGGDGEDLIVASKRELEEETGILAESWDKMGEAYVCNGLMTEKMAFCLAKNLSFSGTKEESDEYFSDMRFFTMQEIQELIINGEINDSQTLAGLQVYNVYLKRKEVAQ